MMRHREDRRRWSDADLLSAIAARDGAAFGVFYRRHLPLVLAFLLRQTGDRELTGDLAAEVFAAVLLSAPGYRRQGDSAAPWVIGIARKKWLMSLRRGRVEARARKRLGFEAVALEDGDLERIETLAEGGAGQLAELVEGLPIAERHAVRSHVVEERSYREIATELDCSEMVVRKRVSRGLARLREQLGEGGSA
jgi:RNA polymerase sigma factor (sigma-70 family)